MNAPLHARLVASVADSVFGAAAALVRLISRRWIFFAFCLAAGASGLVLGQAGDPMGTGFGAIENAAEAARNAPPTPTASNYVFDQEVIIRQISSSVMNAVNNLKDNQKLDSFGKTTTAFFLVLMLVWTSVKSLTAGKGIGELVGEWVPVFVSFGIVTLFLDKGASGLIVSTMDSIAGAIAGSSMTSLEASIRSIAQPVFRSLAAVIEQPRITEGAAATGFLESVTLLGAGLASMIMSLGAKLITGFVLVVVATVCMAHIIMGWISVQLVLALAPVMVPFLMFKPLEWLFQSWLKFLLGACMLKIVVAVLINIVAAMLSGMNSLASTVAADARNASGLQTLQADVMLLGMMMLFAVLAAMLVAQAPGLATGLLAGSAGDGGFKGIKGLSGGAAGKAANAAGISTGSAGATMGKGAFNSVGNLRAQSRGAADAKAGKQSAAKQVSPGRKQAYERGFDANKPPAPPKPEWRD